MRSLMILAVVVLAAGVRPAAGQGGVVRLDSSTVFLLAPLQQCITRADKLRFETPAGSSVLVMPRLVGSGLGYAELTGAAPDLAALVGNPVPQVIESPLVKEMDFPVMVCDLGPFRGPTPQGAAVKGRQALPDIGPDKGPEQLLEFTEIKVRAQGLDPVGQRLVNVKGIVARIDDQPGRVAVQGDQVATPHTAHATIVIRFPDSVAGSAPYGMHRHVHGTADPPDCCSHFLVKVTILPEKTGLATLHIT